jgi:hypothetical protein
MGGYRFDAILFERRSGDPLAVRCKRRGKHSRPLIGLSRLNRALIFPTERALALVGLGRTLACVAHRKTAR